MELSRRSLLGTGLLLASPGALARTMEGLSAKPKNIIFMVSDGMADQIPAMADTYQQLTLGQRSYWARHLQEEGVAFCLQETRSLNSVVTDSSAASSAWGSGRRIWNGQLNIYPDKTELRPIMDVFKAAGVRCGFATTTTITHATPAGFTVSCVQRDLEPLIAEKYLAAGLDVYLGGGDKFFAASARKDQRDLYGDFAAAGYTIVKSRDELLGSTAAKTLGIFSSGHLPYSVDRSHSSELAAKVPTLAEMTAAAIRKLDGGPNGFVLQVEGGRVDHGAHGNDIAASLFDQIAFEDAVKVAIEFAKAEKNTLVVVTSDHATGGPSLNGDGDEYIDATGGLLRLQRMTCSFGDLQKAMGEVPTVASVREAVDGKYAIGLKESEAHAIVDAFNKKSPLGSAKFYNWLGGTLAAILGNYTRVTWTSGNHTAEHVWMTAFGPGSELFKGVVPNFRLNEVLLGLKDLKHENPPQMSFEDAQKHYAKLKLDGIRADLEAEHWA